MSEKTGLNVSLFTLGAPGSEGSYLASLKTVAIRAENQIVDARGIADAFEFNQVVKQGQSVDFTVHLARGDSADPRRRLTNLDVTVWTLDGTDYAGQIRSGEISVSVPVQDRSALKNLERFPVPVGGIQAELRTEMIVIDSAVMTQQLLTSPISGFHVTVGISYGLSSLSLPMMFQSASHRIERGELQVEEAVLQLRGTPTPSEQLTLLGAVLGGATRFGFELNSGAGHYGTSAASGDIPAQVAILTDLRVKFKAGAVIEMDGTLEVQSQMLVA